MLDIRFRYTVDRALLMEFWKEHKLEIWNNKVQWRGKVKYFRRGRCSVWIYKKDDSRLSFFTVRCSLFGHFFQAAAYFLVMSHAWKVKFVKSTCDSFTIFILILLARK